MARMTNAVSGIFLIQRRNDLSMRGFSQANAHCAVLRDVRRRVALTRDRRRLLRPIEAGQPE